MLARPKAMAGSRHCPRSASCPEDAAQHEQGHDGHDLTAEDDAIDVHRPDANAQPEPSIT